MNERIIECGVNFLSFERAKSLVPPEYLYAYEWFQDDRNKKLPTLPMGANAPELPVPIKLARQSGIHTPSYRALPSQGAGRPRYVLSIHSEGSTPGSPYPDMDVVKRRDGTWTLDYCAHKPSFGGVQTQSYNEDMMNNLRDGVPVAVLVRYPKSGYVNYGLAYVERYDAWTGMFTLHGPVSAESTGIDFCSFISLDELSEQQREVFLAADNGDERKKVVAEQIRREKQAEFRSALLAAYNSRCALTGVDVPAVLQAAHIDPYRGKKSQIVTNGLLLRSDIHALYDSCLLTVLPGSKIIRIGERLASSYYGRFDGRRISLPDDPLLHPSDELLELRFKEFESVEGQFAVA